ncbi:MAG: tripartite tricarboxylate transporter TctB family protein, partial [Pseudomonadota bacterium]
PFYGDSGVWGSPGLTPGLISAVLLVLSGLLILRSRRVSFSSIRWGMTVERWRGLAVLGVILAYAAGVPTIGYVPATFLMLLVFQVAFAPRHSLGYFLVWGLGLSAALTVALWWLFGEFFFIPLPRGPLGV